MSFHVASIVAFAVVVYVSTERITKELTDLVLHRPIWSSYAEFCSIRSRRKEDLCLPGPQDGQTGTTLPKVIATSGSCDYILATDQLYDSLRTRCPLTRHPPQPPSIQLGMLTSERVTGINASRIQEVASRVHSSLATRAGTH
jgi:hypothetical protein